MNCCCHARSVGRRRQRQRQRQRRPPLLRVPFSFTAPAAPRPRWRGNRPCTATRSRPRYLRDSLARYLSPGLMVPTPTFVTDNEERRADGFPSRQAGASDRPLPLIWVTCYGSRGDLQPFVALALGLKAAGFRVAMLVPADFEGFVQSAGVDCVPIFADSEAGMSDPECKEFLAKGDLLSFLIWLEKLNKLNLPGTLKRFSAALRAERPDMIVCSTLTELYARLAWLKYLVPFVKVDLQRNPFMKTAKCRAFWGLPDLPLGLTRVISRQLLHGLYKNCQGHDDTVMELEGVKPMANMPWNDFRGRMVVDENYPIHAPTILAATSLFDILTPDSPLPPSVRATGPLILGNAVSNAAADAFGGEAVYAAITAFLSLGEAPVYLGWGSMAVPGKELVTKSVLALKKAARRGIILGGWAKLDAKLLKEAAEEDGDPHGLVEYAAANVLFVDKAPHELVFPKCSVIVHHGGMGTTAASLRSGKPTIITPVLLDQFDAAELVETLGVGKRACSQLLQMTPDELAAAISLATTSEGVQKKAEQVARWIRQENGVEGAVAFIKEQYQSQVVEGKWFDAWVNEQKLTDKSLTASRRTERMMYAAAGFLAGACALMVASRFQVPRWQGV